ncbi:hypothetical protein ICL81_09030 [Leucobacter sp. cx-328]|uniref:hypothetical protein n=1 Tax=unclassified Leucobacter TaxID=2621730 RepID=UPI00165DC4E9|nr:MULTISPECIES: hypothetical protein [unclassified Leucobacter]MBC9944649.1 hypothetical protein [Leucobacter sp. cx-328]
MAGFIGKLIQRKDRMPAFLRNTISYLVSNQDGVLFRTVLRLTGQNRRPIPVPTEVPEAKTRVLIGPANYAGQGRQWARSLELFHGVGAKNLMVSVPGGILFSADTVVPFGVYHLSKEWQRAELQSVAQFTHVLVEAEKPLLGGLFKNDLSRESEALRQRGVRLAYITHGSDTRNPAQHSKLTPWSPFIDRTPEVEALQRLSDKNRALLRTLPGPKFVPTPELLSDLPGAEWCPIVVEQERWQRASKPLFRHELPRVVHIPSKGWIKGTDLVEPIMDELHDKGLVEYSQVTGIPHSQMPNEIGNADIVLEQFRLGIYATTAIEAMAAGRVVIGHVMSSVREHVRKVSGMELPIVEATPDTLRGVIIELIADPQKCREIGEAGARFAELVHDGRLSAEVLTKHWINLPDSADRA